MRHGPRVWSTVCMPHLVHGKDEEASTAQEKEDTAEAVVVVYEALVTGRVAPKPLIVLQTAIVLCSNVCMAGACHEEETTTNEKEEGAPKVLVVSRDNVRRHELLVTINSERERASHEERCRDESKVANSLRFEFSFMQIQQKHDRKEKPPIVSKMMPP